MNINFNRNRTQSNYEIIVGITSVEELSRKKNEFKDYVLTHNNASMLRSVIEYDAVDYLNSGMISLAEGLGNMCEKRYSWATVKLYYSIFYFIRASLATKHYAILQCNSMFRLKLDAGEKPYNKNSRKYNATHSGTINHYKDVFEHSDVLLTNQIDSVDVYEWMEEVRNIVNYREVSFLDPDCLDVWNKYDEALDSGDISAIIKLIFDDDSYIYCFQEEFAVVAIAIKRFQLTIKDFADRGLLNSVEKSRLAYFESLLPVCLRNIGFVRYVNEIVV